MKENPKISGQMISKPESINIIELVTNCLDLQRIETGGQLSLNRRLVNLYDVIADVVASPLKEQT